MTDDAGRRVERWLAHMQSETFLRGQIAAGIRTDECWGELRNRNQRVHAALKAIHGDAWGEAATKRIRRKEAAGGDA